MRSPSSLTTSSLQLRPSVVERPIPGRLDLPMVDTSSVQRDQRHAGAMLDGMDHGSVDPALHSDTVIL